MPSSYTAARGDTLSSIARREYGSADLWPALWYTNRHQVKDPNVLPAGTTLALTAWHPDKKWIYEQALAAIPRPPAAPKAPAAAAPPARAAAAGSTQVQIGSAYQACVIEHESGGDATIVNASSGAGGLYQFLLSTWDSLGFGAAYPGGAQTAPPAVQTQAFWKLYGEAGRSPWITDGC